MLTQNGLAVSVVFTHTSWDTGEEKQDFFAKYVSAIFFLAVFIPPFPHFPSKKWKERKDWAFLLHFRWSYLFKDMKYTLNY